MTADEVSFAGGLTFNGLKSPYTWYYSNSLGKYIIGRTGYSYIMSPGFWNGTSSTVHNVAGEDGHFSNGWSVTSSVNVRPVISLKACVKYSSGDGSSSNPYQVTIDSACETAEN